MPFLALSQMRSGRQEAACCRRPWGYLTTTSRATWVYHLATLRHFDTNVGRQAILGPLIPCERRLAKREIPEFQEVNSGTLFGNRDYDRPFDYFSVTLRRFD